MPIEVMADGLQRIADAVHTTAATVASDLPGAEAIAETQIVDSGSNGVSLVKGKTDSLAKAKLLRVAHRRHKFVLRIVRFMLRNSLRNKVRIMVPGFVASLLAPPALVAGLRPAFALFGAHLGMEAAHDAKQLVKAKRLTPPHHDHVLGETPDPEKVLDEKVPNKMTMRQVIEKAHKADKITTFEITAAVLGSIDNLPVAEQIPIMGMYVAGMTAGVYGVTTALVKMEDWGQRLEVWQPQHPANKLLVRTTLPAHVGSAMQRAAPRIFRAMPWAGAAAKFVTSGRVISHAFPALENSIEHAAHTVSTLTPVGAGEFLTTVGAWGLVGLGAGLGASTANKLVCQPIVETLEDRGVFQQWRHAVGSLFVRASMLRSIPSDYHTATTTRAPAHYPLRLEAPHAPQLPPSLRMMPALSGNGL